MIHTHGLIDLTRAIGEPNRLRMLRLCRTQRVAVSEFAQVLGISEPSVSRHIKLLEDAALVTRARQGQRVYFSAVTSGDAAVVAGLLLDQLNPAQVELQSDSLRLAALRAAPLGAATGEADKAGTTRLERALMGCVENELRASTAPTRISVLRVQRAPLLRPLLALSASLQLMADDVAQRSALQRWLLAQEGAAPARVRIVERRSAKPATLCDLVIADCSGAALPEIQELLRQGSAALAPAGRLWLLVGYDALDGQGAGEHPLLRLRRLLAEAGLAGERLQPIEVEGEHILFSVSTVAAQSLRAAG